MGSGGNNRHITVSPAATYRNNPVAHSSYLMIETMTSIGVSECPEI